ncbi:MAG TPA: hypothetical protein VII78_15990 [Myxococcota bacterium]|jgi:hypothetical protein
MLRRLVRFRALGALALTLTALLSVAAIAEERVALVPERPPPWRISRALAGLRDGARAARELRVETAPPGAQLELAYLRDGAQLALARGVAPLVALLPAAALTGDGDRVVVRAQLPGFAEREIDQAALRAESTLRIALTPLPAGLRAISLLELADRSRLTLRSDRPLGARLTPTEQGWRLVLADAAFDARIEAAVAGLRGNAIEGAALKPVASDVMLELTIREDGRELRLAQESEPVRGVGRLSLEWLPADGGAGALARVHRALARLGARSLDACAESFERTLCDALGSQALARALAPSGAFSDAYVVLALERLAALSPRGEIALRDGSRLRIDGSAARALAVARAPEVRGLLVALRELSAALAPAGASEAALQAWIAPESARDEFVAAYARAVQAEASCRALP